MVLDHDLSETTPSISYKRNMLKDRNAAAQGESGAISPNFFLPVSWCWAVIILLSIDRFSHLFSSNSSCGHTRRYDVVAAQG